MIKRYPVLRSGFITFTDEGLRQPDTPFDDTAAALLGKTHLTPNDDHFYHEGIQKLYVKMVKDAQTGILDHADVQESILKNAAQAFGTKNFFSWLELQTHNPNLAPIHLKFLIETLNYIKGAPRQMNVMQWHRLLEINTNNDRSNIRSDNAARDLKECFADKQLPHKLSDVIVMWIRRDNGWYDFLATLQAIFGNRRSQTGYLG